MNYNSHNFISSEAIVAKVKQQLKSYFDSGSLTDVLIPTYIDRALRKLKYMVLKGEDDVVEIENYMGKLPSDFSYLDRAYVCQALSVITNADFSSRGEWYRKITCDKCVDNCSCVTESLDIFSVQTTSSNITYKMGEMMKIYYGSRKYCIPDAQSLRSTSLIEARIDKKTITTNFAHGSVYITYFSRPEDEFGPLIPEIVEVEEYIEAFIKFELFDQLWNAVTDESYNQISQKRQVYEREKYAKFEAARNTLKLETSQQVRDSIVNQRLRLKKFDIF